MTPDGQRPPLRAIFEAVSVVSNVSAAEIMGDARSPNVIAARRLWCVAARLLGGASYPVIGRYIARDHTTAVYHVLNAHRVPRQALDEVAALARGDRRVRRARLAGGADPVESHVAASPARPTPPEADRRPPAPAIAQGPALVSAALESQRFCVKETMLSIEEQRVREWFEQNNARFVAAMRAAYPEREVRLPTPPQQGSHGK
jgi:hypothetical protein